MKLPIIEIYYRHLRTVAEGSKASTSGLGCLGAELSARRFKGGIAMIVPGRTQHIVELSLKKGQWSVMLGEDDLWRLYSIYVRAVSHPSQNPFCPTIEAFPLKNRDRLQI